MNKEELLKLLRSKLSKEDKKHLQKLMELCFIEGVDAVKNILNGLDHINPLEINNYGIWHEDNLDGG